MGPLGMTRPPSLSPGYFDALYAEDPDPWRFETSEYERSKYEETVRSLGRARYGRVLEVGCSIGVLTARLAPFCSELVAIDVAEAALACARDRLRGVANVCLATGALPDDLPPGPFDLIVLSEVLYYLNDDDLRRAARACLERLAPDGEVLLVHWLGETPDYPLTGDEAANGFLKAVEEGLTTDLRLRRERYRLERLLRSGG